MKGAKAIRLLRLFFIVGLQLNKITFTFTGFFLLSYSILYAFFYLVIQFRIAVLFLAFIVKLADRILYGDISDVCGLFFGCRVCVNLLEDATKPVKG